ncbi:MAG: collagen triple helix repeat domain-containing, partial [Chitinophagaceae bacterium]
MKKYLLILMLLASVSFGKLSAQQLNYQGIARNANGVAMTFQEISLRLTIRDGSSTGISVYSETRLVRTNQFGLFTIVIGSPGASNISG